MSEQLFSDDYADLRFNDLVTWHLNIDAIHEALISYQAAFPALSPLFSERHDLPSGQTISNLIEAFQFIDWLHLQNINIFELGNSSYLLELNARVLCGTDSAERASLASHLEATEEHFYSGANSGVDGFIRWYNIHQNQDPHLLAAGLFVHIMKQPQLFIEGNHRTGTLLANYILLRSGNPPFILDRENAVAFFELTAKVRKRGNNLYWRLWQKAALQRELAALLRRYTTNAAYLKAC